MSSILKWRPVAVDPTVSVKFTVTGNVDTRVVTRFFWLPVSNTVIEKQKDCDDGEVFEFDPVLMQAGQQNHLGFSSLAVPILPTETNLFIVFQVRQGDKILLEQDYRLTSSDPNVPVSQSDGISLT